MKSCRRPLWTSFRGWVFGAIPLLPFVVSPAGLRREACGGILIFESILCPLLVAYLWIYNRFESDDREIRIVNALGRIRRYRYDELRRVELLNDMRTQPRLRLTTRDGRRRWFHLEGIRTRDYRTVAEEFERHGIPVDTHRMERYLGSRSGATGARRPSSSRR